jgi:hypothetical protein
VHSFGASSPVLIKKPASRSSPRFPSGFTFTWYETVTVRSGFTVPPTVSSPSATTATVTPGSELVGLPTSVASSSTPLITSANPTAAGAAPVLVNVSV